jgi:hypothetical protein
MYKYKGKQLHFQISLRVSSIVLGLDISWGFPFDYIIEYSKFNIVFFNGFLMSN